MARRLVDLVGLSEYTGIGVRTLRKYISEGEITAYRLGDRFLRVDLDEIDERFCRPIPTASRSERLEEVR